MRNNINDLNKIKIALQAFSNHNHQYPELVGMLNKHPLDQHPYAWQPIDFTLADANSVRQTLFELRKQLNAIPEAPGLHACKLAVHEKLINLAQDYPLNEHSSRYRMRCQLSKKIMGWDTRYDEYKDSVVLSNGYIYDTSSLLDALGKPEAFPNLGNISERDVARIREINQSCRTQYRRISAIIVGGLSTVVGVFLLAIFAPALPVVMAATIGIAASVGICTGGILSLGLITGLLSYWGIDFILSHSREEQRKIERIEALHLTSSTNNILRAVTSNGTVRYKPQPSSEAIPLLDASSTNSMALQENNSDNNFQSPTLQPIYITRLTGPGSYQ